MKARITIPTRLDGYIPPLEEGLGTFIGPQFPRISFPAISLNAVHGCRVVTYRSVYLEVTLAFQPSLRRRVTNSVVFTILNVGHVHA